MDTENMQIVESQVSNVDIAEEDNDEQSQKRKKQINVDFKMVTFSLSGKDYAIDIMNVKEIAKAGHFTYVPNTLPFGRFVFTNAVLSSSSKTFCFVTDIASNSLGLYL